MIVYAIHTPGNRLRFEVIWQSQPKDTISSLLHGLVCGRSTSAIFMLFGLSTVCGRRISQSLSGSHG
jgi:hypothetical protein